MRWTRSGEITSGAQAHMTCGFTVFLVGAALFCMARGFFCFEALGLTHQKPTDTVALWHQYLLNFMGAAVGCGASWLLWRHWPNDGQPTWPQVGLALAAFVGLTGYMPWTIVGLTNIPGEVAKAIIKKLGA